MQPDDLLIHERPFVASLPVGGPGRIIAIGDLHGCRQELDALLAKLNPDHYDTVVFLGDLVDRGPDSGGVIARVRELCLRPQYWALLGNHDEWHVRYRRHALKAISDPSYRNPMRLTDYKVVVQGALTDDDFKWMAGLPHAVEFRTPQGLRVMTHAGLLPGKGYGLETRAFVRTRYVKLMSVEGEERRWAPVAAVRDGDSWLKPPGAVEWCDVHPGTPRVIYGHAARPNVKIVNDTWGIDTGCCFGGSLTSYVEDLSEGYISLVSVPARAEYAKPNWQSEDM